MPQKAPPSSKATASSAAIQDALLDGRWTDARSLLTAVCDAHAICLATDHEGDLFEGTYGSPRTVAPRLCVELARSWEQFDRAFTPIQDAQVATSLDDQLDAFLAATGLPRCLGDDHLFVFSLPPSPWCTVVISRPFPAAPSEQAARIAGAYRMMNNA